ncbi:MAG: iron-sulfur cluster loop [Candidatus Odinarchaeota archaeon]
MIQKKNEIVSYLINEGSHLLLEVKKPILSEEDEINDFLTDIENYPHIYVLFCLSQRFSRAGPSSKTPYLLSREIGGADFPQLLKMSEKDFIEVFNINKIHRFPNKMANTYFKAIQRIHNTYQDDASKIWEGNPRSATIVKRFLGFDGASIKIATMAANILAREFKIKMRDHICIDISVDTHTRRVFKRLGLVSINANDYEIIYTARELNPKYPGIFDLPCWNIGRECCKAKNPICNRCKLEINCPKIL